MTMRCYPHESVMFPPTDCPDCLRLTYTAATEAAARSNFAFQRNSEDVRPLPSWESRADWLKDTYRREAAASLAAAVPHLTAGPRALHSPVEVHSYDSINGVWRLDDDGNPVVLDRLCRGCTDDETLEALGDCEWREGDGIPWPCATVRLLDAIEAGATSEGGQS